VGADNEAGEIENRTPGITPECPPVVLRASKRVSIDRGVRMGMIVEDPPGGDVPMIVGIRLSDEYDIRSNGGLLATEANERQRLRNAFQCDESEVCFLIDMCALPFEDISVRKLNLHGFA